MSTVGVSSAVASSLMTSVEVSSFASTSLMSTVGVSSVAACSFIAVVWVSSFETVSSPSCLLIESREDIGSLFTYNFSWGLTASCCSVFVSVFWLSILLSVRTGFLVGSLVNGITYFSRAIWISFLRFFIRVSQSCIIFPDIYYLNSNSLFRKHK